MSLIKIYRVDRKQLEGGWEPPEEKVRGVESNGWRYSTPKAITAFREVDNSGATPKTVYDIVVLHD
jgi:hypothetical protein